MKIAVIGGGYAGLVTGVCFSNFMKVRIVDSNKEKIESLQAGKTPFYEPGLDELIKKNRDGGRLSFTISLAEAMVDAEVIIIAVGTPDDGAGNADLKYVCAVAQEIGRNLDHYAVVVTKSTVPPGTNAMVKRIILENLVSPIEFDVASNPEFLREGSAIKDFLWPDRVVVGVENERARKVMEELYRPLSRSGAFEGKMLYTNLETAELIKYAANAFLAAKISFINQLVVLCEELGADITQVAKGMGTDNRIGGKFLHAGPGYGGSCFPKDTFALLRLAQALGFELPLVEATIRVNERQRDYAVRKIIVEALGTLPSREKRVVALLGLSFKPETDDVRCSPAMDIADELLDRGIVVQAYDPEAMSNAMAVLPEITYCSDPYAACCGADVVVLATEWNEFRGLDLAEIKQRLRNPIFVDLRNVYSSNAVRKEGLTYLSVGRPQ